jgi:hypothetical protein
MNSVSRELFAMLRRAIPSIPEHCTRMELVLDKNGPVVKCDFIIKKSRRPEVQHARFEITEMKP